MIKEKKKQSNPRAFSFNNVISAERSFRKRADISQKRAHLPDVDRDVDDAPPVLVAIAGPPKVGKTTLTKCLLKHYCKLSIGKVEGPVTVVANKQRRITFIECPNDILSMIDVVKCADLVLIMIDASFGFQMEIFEFLAVCQAHGFPRIMGVLNHLDCFKSVEKRRQARKLLKNRFWSEVYKGAKMFYLTRLLDNESYIKHEIHNLLEKFNREQSSWRSTHPFMLVDRIERRSASEGLVSVNVYGYLRGFSLRSRSKVHLSGCGDFEVVNVQKCSDPCPLPERDEQKRRRSLRHIERGVYGHFSGLGGIIYDEETVTIDLHGSHLPRSQKDVLANCIQQPVTNTNNNKVTLSYPPQTLSSISALAAAFPQSVRLVASDDDECEADECSDGEERRITESAACFDELDLMSSGDDDEDEQLTNKNLFFNKSSVENWHEIVYGNSQYEVSESVELSAGMFKAKQKSVMDNEDYHYDICTNIIPPDKIIDMIRNCFVTGEWDEDSDAEIVLKKEHPAEVLNSSDNDEETPFMRELNEKAQKQAMRNKELVASLSDKERAVVAGYEPGTYLKLELTNVPVEFIDNFDPKSVLLLGAVNPIEENFEIVHVRLKKHRFHGRILKSRDPVIISIGWRKFQVTPLYFCEDHNLRKRFLKYTPEHAYCHAAFFAPSCPKNHGCVFLQDYTARGFRVAATGVTLESDKALKIVKKLKLTGEPFKLWRKTVFVNGKLMPRLKPGLTFVYFYVFCTVIHHLKHIFH